MPFTENEQDEKAQDALGEVRLKRFVAEPSSIGPFHSSRLAWEVEVPKDAGVAVRIDLDGAPVPATGTTNVSPQFSSTYHLRARAGRYAKALGTATVHVELERCVTLSDAPVRFVAGAIEQKINTDTSGLYFRALPQNVPRPPTARIEDDRLIIALRLGKRIAYFPDAAVDIDASFALDVGPDSGRHGVGAVSAFPSHRLIPTREEIAADVSFPPWAWAIGFIGLAIAVDDAQGKAHQRARSIINQIVDLLNNWFKVAATHGLDKHDASFFIEDEGMFSVTWCPPLEPVVAPG